MADFDVARRLDATGDKTDYPIRRDDHFLVAMDGCMVTDRCCSLDSPSLGLFVTTEGLRGQRFFVVMTAHEYMERHAAQELIRFRDFGRLGLGLVREVDCEGWDG